MVMTGYEFDPADAYAHDTGWRPGPEDVLVTVVLNRSAGEHDLVRDSLTIAKAVMEKHRLQLDDAMRLAKEKPDESVFTPQDVAEARSRLDRRIVDLDALLKRGSLAPR